MRYFTVQIFKDGESEYVKVVAANLMVAIDWALKHCKIEGASVADVIYVNSDPVAIVEE